MRVRQLIEKRLFFLFLFLNKRKNGASKIVRQGRTCSWSPCIRPCSGHVASESVSGVLAPSPLGLWTNGTSIRNIIRKRGTGTEPKLAIACGTIITRLPLWTCSPSSCNWMPEQRCLFASCSGSGSVRSVCFWASWSRILRSSSKTSMKNLDSSCFVTLFYFSLWKRM